MSLIIYAVCIINVFYSKMNYNYIIVNNLEQPNKVMKILSICIPIILVILMTIILIKFCYGYFIIINIYN